MKRRFLLGRKVMTNLDSILKSRDIILPTKVHRVKAMVFLVDLHGCESWSIKKAECQRLYAFVIWCWRLLRVPSTISNQSILEEMRPDYSLERLMLKPKLQYCGQYWKSWWEELTNLKRPWCWERLKVGGDGDDRGRDGWMASLTQWTYIWVNSRSWETWCARVHGVAKSQTWLSDWTKLNHVNKPRLAFQIIRHLISFSFWL